jgi:hypothetical protein
MVRLFYGQTPCWIDEMRLRFLKLKFFKLEPLPYDLTIRSFKPFM